MPWASNESAQRILLKLEKLIQLKEQLGREKDRAMLPVLERTLEEKRKRS